MLAYLFPMISALVFGLRFAGGAYDRPEMRIPESSWTNPTLKDPVIEVDLPSEVWRILRPVERAWRPVSEDQKIGAGFFWLFGVVELIGLAFVFVWWLR